MKGPFLCAQAVLGHMKSRRSGCIINMSSLAAKTGGVAAGPPYAASKAGVSAMTIGLARAVAAHGIRVNAIAPGVIDTQMTASPAHDPVKAQIPLGSVGQPEDVANCALFLASEEARHITGEIIDVNGGLFMD
jgi:3-oxoacyl-[acyl-carrier protein] reductase